MRCLAILIAALAACGVGCTRESVRVAIETQRRADQVQQTVFDQQHESLRILLYRDLVSDLQAGGDTLSDEQRAALNSAWNERDRLEFWAVQHERAKALRLIGVDAKLYSDQSIIDLMYKSLIAKFDRGKQTVAEFVGEKVTK